MFLGHHGSLSGCRPEGRMQIPLQIWGFAFFNFFSFLAKAWSTVKVFAEKG